MQNLTNQRAFRQRKENYIQTLENKVLNLEMLYTFAQNEIEALKQKVVMLEKKIDSSRSSKNRGIVGSAMYQAIVDNQTSFYVVDEQKNKVISCIAIMNNVSRMLNIYNSLTTSSNAIYIRTDNKVHDTKSYTPITVTPVQLNQLLIGNNLSLSVQLTPNVNLAYIFIQIQLNLMKLFKNRTSFVSQILSVS